MDLVCTRFGFLIRGFFRSFRRLVKHKTNHMNFLGLGPTTNIFRQSPLAFPHLDSALYTWMTVTLTGYELSPNQCFSELDTDYRQ